MPAATEAVTDQPTGYINNLTPEQVEKLKQLWGKLFEIYDQQADHSGESTPTGRSRQGSTDSKSSFGSFFGKKKKVERESVFLTSTFNDASGTSPLPLEEAIKSVSGKHLKDACWSAIGVDNPDALLLRFLRARKWDVDNALTMLSAALRWRIEERVDEIIHLGEAGLREELERLDPGASQKWLDQFSSGKSFLGGPDKGGRPVCYINVKLHNKEAQSLEIMKCFTILTMETGRLLVAQPVETTCMVFNMADFTLANMDFDFVKFLVTCFEAYYPESLGVCLIHKAPWVFSAVWSMIQPILDPVVATKIHFTKTDEDILEYIDKENLPEILNGTASHSGKYDAPPATSVVDAAKEFPEFAVIKDKYEAATREWAASSGSSMEGRKDLALEYRLARLKIENEARAKTHYHRVGMINVDDGRIRVNYQNENSVEEDLTERV
ncbi:CRAL-TRIO domain-containing protein [Umbelopsis sp. PMI_123]|nr:CRAL-TRIO domain-containing protein [Umbelopsis sp. PMI_123]